jgi:mannonate dehydratase
MILAEFLPPKPHALWAIARQLGVTHAIVKAARELTGLPHGSYDLASLSSVVAQFREAELTVAGLEGDQFDMSRIKLGLAGRDDDLDRYRAMLSNMAELGIPLICYNFMAGPGWFRTGAAPARGGATACHFRAADALDLTPAGRVSADRIWDNFAYFLRAVIPHAEKLGIRMALHPDDPPLPELSGVARVFGSVESFDRAYALAPCRATAVTFCQANFKLMGTDLASAARHFGDRIAFVHVRDVRGTPADFVEVFHDEMDVDQPALFDLYANELKLDVPVRCDHVPTMTGDDQFGPHVPGYGTLGRLFAIGYFKGILHARGIAFR